MATPWRLRRRRAVAKRASGERSWRARSPVRLAGERRKILGALSIFSWRTAADCRSFPKKDAAERGGGSALALAPARRAGGRAGEANLGLLTGEVVIEQDP